MASIGPTLPPHLAKRKRTPDDEASTGSPPTKIRASESTQTNKDEIELESNSDDGYGPSAPKPTASIGPTLPLVIPAGPSLPQNNADEIALDSEDDETIGPSAPLPPTTNSTRPSIGPTLPPTNTNEIPLDSEDEDDVGPAPPEPKRVHGPAPPPAALSERPPTSADSESNSDSDDDDYGPALPSSTSHQQRQARALAAAEAEAATAKAPKRDDWMLAPPSAGGYRAADPTKLKARRFNSGPRANTGGQSGGEISSIWTETPEEKRKRLENAVLGRDTGAGPNSTSSSSARPRPTKEDAEQAARIQSFTEATRGRSLYEEHQAARARGDVQSHVKGADASKSWADEEDDDPSKRAFDKEKDMKLGGRIGASQRRELVNKAADFGGRFAKGKYL
ncbi:hypothetical protein GQX73_g3655 [Xylaria multiplex]|uniref:DUF3752 domain-containing protein n=1 Tax=Xylaria multiplex TaxID=323545 RepID=A0A7C8J3E4_9PEZI|nr:hypothetical protein GQX73_g3655 [Xylaria multiplex]